MFLTFITFLAIGFGLGDAAITSMSSTHSKFGPRTATLMQYNLGGSKNVRWETRPMVYLDANGNPVDPTAMGAKTDHCIDVNGQQQANGAEYQRPNKHFVFRCNNGNEEVIACVGSQRTNNARIAVGQSQDVNGLWHKCEKAANGSVIYTQANSCMYGGKEIAVDVEFNVGNLRMVCADSGYRVVGCAFVDGSGQKTQISPGETREVNGVTHNCKEQAGQLQYFTTLQGGCVKNGKEYKEGEEFEANHLHYKCQNGVADVTGCYKGDNVPMTIGQDIVENHMVYRCYSLGTKVEYNEYACGFNGTPSCSPAPISQTEALPKMAQGPNQRGFGAFMAVEKEQGSDRVAMPSKFQLGLDKFLMGANQGGKP